MHHDFEIQGQGNIFNINQIVFHPFNHFINVFSVSELYHAPGSNTRFYFEQVFKIGCYLQNAFEYKSGLSGLGPTRLISPRITFSNWGSSSIRHLRMVLPHRVIRSSYSDERNGSVYFGVLYHGPEFMDHEFLTLVYLFFPANKISDRENQFLHEWLHRSSAAKV